MNKFKYYFSLLLIVSIAFVNCSDDTIEDIPYTPQTEIGQKLLSKSDVVARVFTDTTFVVALGVTETDVHLQKSNGRSTHVFIIDIDLNTPGVSIDVAMPYNTDVRSDFQRQTLTEMADYADYPGHRVAAMINADFWDISTMDIRGPIHRKGIILKDNFVYSDRMPQQALSFIAMTKDNKMVIADSAEYKVMKYNLKEVTGSGVIVLRNGKISGAEFPQLDPRTCVGYSDNGHVYFFVVDGRVEYYSYGMTYPEMGSVMKSLGCSWASNLDGGGSAQMLIRHPIADTFQIRNRPSDGAERPVVNAWEVTVDEP